MKTIFILLSIYLFCGHHFCFADEEVENRPYVQASSDGIKYVKSVPSGPGGTKGKTVVFQVREGQDSIFRIYNWYSHFLFVTDLSVVRLGPWNIGHKPNDSDIAIAFYQFDGKEKVYSTKAIEKISGKYTQSVSHYEVFKHVDGVIDGYLKNGKATSMFVVQVLKVTLTNEKKMYFNMENGDILDKRTVFLTEGFDH